MFSPGKSTGYWAITATFQYFHLLPKTPCDKSENKHLNYIICFLPSVHTCKFMNFAEKKIMVSTQKKELQPETYWHKTHTCSIQTNFV